MPISSPVIPPPQQGECQFCGCTDAQACSGGCWWIDAAHTMCDAPECWTKYMLALAHPSPAQPSPAQEFEVRRR